MKSAKDRKPSPGMKFVPPDGGWGWIVLVGCGLINASI